MATQQQLTSETTAELANLKEETHDYAAENTTLKEMIAHQQLLLAQPIPAIKLSAVKVDGAFVQQELLSATPQAAGNVKVLFASLACCDLPNLWFCLGFGCGSSR